MRSRCRACSSRSEFFSILGIPPLLGRGIQSGEDAVDGQRTAVLSYSFWQQQGTAAILRSSAGRLTSTACPLTSSARRRQASRFRFARAQLRPLRDQSFDRPARRLQLPDRRPAEAFGVVAAAVAEMEGSRRRRRASVQA